MEKGIEIKFSQESNTTLAIDIDKIYSQADADSRLGAPGVKIGFAKSRSKGVSMDYSFDVPMAFGMRLVPFVKVNPDGTFKTVSTAAPGTLVHEVKIDPTLRELSPVLMNAIVHLPGPREMRLPAPPTEVVSAVTGAASAASGAATK